MDRRQVILEAVRRAKKSQFGVTAIKVELEANLWRNWDEEECHVYMMQELEGLGLAYVGDYSEYLSHEDYETNWRPKGPLKYAEFYNDGSVDSEFTFTIMLNNEENIFLIEDVVKIWNRLCQEAGDTIEVDGAGMHMAFLNSEDGDYPTSCRTAHYTRYRNFRSSMSLLMPALYFLGSSNEKSRGIDYRRPGVDNESHRSAIDWRNGALEFRVFDTCYDNPSAILDNFVVMSKCLRYWSNKSIPNGLDKITRRVSFGNNQGYDLDRFYTSYTHLDLLNGGLVRLKPDYYSIGQIKKQRGFTKTKTHVKGELVRRTKAAQAEYKEYEERFTWVLKYEHAKFKASQFNRAVDDPGFRNLTEEDLEREADVYTEKYGETQKLPLDQYIKDRLKEYKDSLRGEYMLSA